MRSRLTTTMLVTAALLPAVGAGAQEVPEPPSAICIPIPDNNDSCPTWVRSHAPGNGSPTAPAVTPDGELVIIAGSAGDTFENAAGITTIAYDIGTGEPAWTSVYEGPEGFNDYALDLALSPDGETAYLTGAQDAPQQFDPTTAGEMVTVALDTATGAVRWSTEGSRGTGTAVTVSEDGSVFATGATQGDYVTVSYDPEDGSVLWSRRYDGEAHGGDAPKDIVAAGGRVFVTGGQYVSGAEEGFAAENDRDMATLAYDARSGQDLWRRVDGSGVPEWSWDEGDALLASPDGSTLYVSGRSHFNVHSVLTALDAESGTRRWHRLLPLSSLTGVALTPSGDRILLTGMESSAQFSGDLTVAFDTATGGNVWQAQFLDNDDEGWGPTSYDVVVSPDGSTAYVTGTERQPFPPLTWDGVVTAYAMDDGTTKWFAEYNSSRIKNDITITHHVTVAPDGETVFTAGFFAGPETGSTQRGWAALSYPAEPVFPPIA